MRPRRFYQPQPRGDVGAPDHAALILTADSGNLVPEGATIRPIPWGETPTRATRLGVPRTSSAGNQQPETQDDAIALRLASKSIEATAQPARPLAGDVRQGNTEDHDGDAHEQRQDDGGDDADHHAATHIFKNVQR